MSLERTCRPARPEKGPVELPLITASKRSPGSRAWAQVHLRRTHPSAVVDPSPGFSSWGEPAAYRWARGVWLTVGNVRGLNRDSRSRLSARHRTGRRRLGLRSQYADVTFALDGFSAKRPAATASVVDVSVRLGVTLGERVAVSVGVAVSVAVAV
jgi:hypothetical protein